MSERGREWKLEVYLDSLSEGGGSDGMLVHGVCARVFVCWPKRRFCLPQSMKKATEELLCVNPCIIGIALNTSNSTKQISVKIQFI